MSEFPWEDNLIERKLESDLKDVLKTLVGYANSVKPGHIATLLIGEKNDGSVAGVTNPDNIQKSIRNECDKIYPPIISRSQIYEKDGKHCVRVEVEYSGETPHFGGSAWIRKGSETIKATDEVFQKLIDIRTGKVSEIIKWINKQVTMHADQSHLPPIPIGVYGQTITGQKGHAYQHRLPVKDCFAKIISVNNFWVTFQISGEQNQSEPLEKILLSYDNANNRLKIIVLY
ncbi:MAG: ATP-binding protein [Bacteroidetes bacterium]|nr:ATP-binding protein [Bacteroidota bacterium]